MKQFVSWWNDVSADLDGIVRALKDMALAQDEKSGMRLYGLSSEYRALKRPDGTGYDTVILVSG